MTELTKQLNSEDNKYFDDYDLWHQDSSGYNITIDNISEEKQLAWGGGSFFKGGEDLLIETMKKSFEEKIPYSEQGNIVIKLIVGSEEDKKEIQWKTHNVYFKQEGVEGIFSVLHKAVKEANDLNPEYAEYSDYNQQMEDEKEARKQGYYYDSSLEEKAIARNKEKEKQRNKIKDKKEQKDIEDVIVNKEPSSLGTLGDIFEFAGSSKTVRKTHYYG